MRSTSKEIQQSFYLRLGDRDWDLYEANEYVFLKRKIGFALYGNPENIETEDNGGYSTSQNEEINKIFDVLIENGCCNEIPGRLLISIIFIVCEKGDSLFVVPLFKIRKCEDSPRQNCQLFVDNLGRVYQSFQLFLLENVLPECNMIVPRNGTYKGRILDSTGSEPQLEVILDEFESPACGVVATITNVGDTISTVAGVGSTVVMGASLIPVVAMAPVVLTGAAVISGCVGVWGLVRGSCTLYDRYVHNQPIGLGNRESQMCYLSIAGGITFAATAGASSYISSAARSGTNISQGTRMAYNAIVISSVILNGAGVINSGYNIFIEIQNGNKPTPLEIFQFTSQVLFFSHSVVNVRSANSIIKETQTSTIREYEQSLRSNRHRKMFRKATLESQRIHGHESGNQETIRGLKHINNKDDFFAGLVRTNKDFNRNQARFTITSDGKISINSVHIVDPMEFSSIGVNGRQQVFSNVPRPQPTLTNAEFNTNHMQINTKVLELIANVSVTCVSLLGEDFFSDDNTRIITVLISRFSQTIQNYILQLLVKFTRIIEDFVDDLERVYPFKKPIIIFLQYLIYYSESQITIPNDSDGSISDNNVIEQIFRELLNNQIYFDELIQSFHNWIISRIATLLSTENNTNVEETLNRVRVVCSTCMGYFYK